jgi:hypothetical protein
MPIGTESTCSQSAAEPDWAYLPPDYLLSPPDGQANPAVKPIDAAYARIEAGAQYVFRVRANPTCKVDTKSGPNGERRNGRRGAHQGNGADRLAPAQGGGGFALLMSGPPLPNQFSTPRPCTATTCAPPRARSTMSASPGQKLTGRRGAYQPGPAAPAHLRIGVSKAGCRPMPNASARHSRPASARKAYGFICSIAPAGADERVVPRQQRCNETRPPMSEPLRSPSARRCATASYLYVERARIDQEDQAIACTTNAARSRSPARR